MPSKLAIDDRLLEEALRLSGHRTKKATVNEALEEYVLRRKRVKALEALGAIDFDPAHDYRAGRRSSVSKGR